MRDAAVRGWHEGRGLELSTRLLGRRLREIAGLVLVAVREIILACALALHPESFRHDPGGHHDPDNAATFWREWKWITDLLEHMYPDDEFLIIPHRNRIRPPGWEKVIFEWRGHSIYRKPKPDFYTSA